MARSNAPVFRRHLVLLFPDQSGPAVLHPQTAYDSSMGKRVNNGPGDDPDEYWFECDDCEGTGVMNFPVTDEEGNLEEGVSEPGTCPGCDGLGFIGGDASDVD